MVTCQPSDTNYPNPFRGAIPPKRKSMAKKENAAIAGKAGKTAKKGKIIYQDSHKRAQKIKDLLVHRFQGLFFTLYAWKGAGGQQRPGNKSETN